MNIIVLGIVCRNWKIDESNKGTNIEEIFFDLDILIILPKALIFLYKNSKNKKKIRILSNSLTINISLK